ncbi:MAG: hypothetical protein AAFX06_02000 [Planctomycetota bacterium]
MLRFTLLVHTVEQGPQWRFRRESTSIASGSEHLDWLFETEPSVNAANEDEVRSLLTWATDAVEGEPLGLKRTIEAIQLPPHRHLYLDFEGDIDGDRGHVRQAASGEYRSVQRSEDLFEAELFPHSGEVRELPTIKIAFHRNENHWRLEIDPL